MKDSGGMGGWRRVKKMVKRRERDEIEQMERNRGKVVKGMEGGCFGNF